MIINGINAVAKETGIHPSSLRRWEAMGLILPGRVDFGDTWARIYEEDEIALLKRVKELMDEGYRLRAAFEKAEEEMEEE